MGNKLYLGVPGEAIVRVYHGDNGQLLQFPKPVAGATLMREHPNYLLVYSVIQVRQTVSAYRSRVFRRSVHLRLVRPADYLRSGHDYFLVHIPDQYRPIFAKYFDLSQSHLWTGCASPQSKDYSSPSASPLYTPTASPLYSPTASPLYSPTASPLYSQTASPSRSFHSSTASPLYSQTASPSRSFHSSTASPLYSQTASPSRSFHSSTASPLYSQTASPSRSFHSSTASPLYSQTASPSRSFHSSTASPRRSFYNSTASPLADPIQKSRFSDSARDRTRVATPRSTYIPTPFYQNIRTRETTRVATPQSTHISARRFNGTSRETTRVSTPLSNHIPIRYDNCRGTTRVATPLSSHIPIRLNDNCRGPTRVTTLQPIQNPIPSPFRCSTQETTRVLNQMHTQRSPAHSIRIQSPGGPGTPRQHITLGSIISISQYNVADFSKQKGSPTGSVNCPGRVMPRAAPQDTMSNIVDQNHSQAQQNSPNRLARSPGNCAVAASQIATKGNFNQRLKGSSQYYSKNSPRRSSKSGSGKFNLRQRRSGTRSHSYPKASVSSKSPGREAVNAPFLSKHNTGESRTTTGAAKGAAPPVPAQAPGGKIDTTSGVNAPISRPKRGFTFRSGLWAPGLGSISEDTISDPSDVDESSVRRHFVWKPRSSLFRRAI